MAMEVTREGEHAYLRMTGQRRFEIFPETPSTYFMKETDVQVTFNRGAEGSVSGLTLHQNGHDIAARRESAP